MTIEASLLAIAEQAAVLTKAVDANTTNPGMTTVLERLIKALDRNTNVHLAKSGAAPEMAVADQKAEMQAAEAGEIPANLKRNKPAEAKKADAAKAEAKPAAKPVAAKIEYATLQQKGLDVIAKFGKEHFVAWLGERALSNLKQAHVDDYAKLVEDLDAELAKEVEEDLT